MAAKKAGKKKSPGKKKAAKKTTTAKKSAAVAPTRARFENISAASWEHATDRAALHALRTLPGFDTVIRKVIGAIGERNVRLIFTAQALEVGPDGIRAASVGRAQRRRDPLTDVALGAREPE